MLKLIILLGGLFLFGCTPTVKKVALFKGKREVILVKKGSFFFSEEDRVFLREESRRLGIPIPDRKEIERYMRAYLSNRKSLETALRRANLYAPYIKPILREYGLPEELSLLPLIESGFNPFAISKSGAAGIWQLMPFTAKRYGLRVDKEVDERFDLIKSTHAAAQYLRYLYDKFGRWELVLAAYNCGEGCVERRTGGVDFWRSKWALPKQTRKYVPMFFASLLIARSPEKYGLNVDLENLELERKYVKRRERVKDFVLKAKLGESTFRDMNPHIRGDTIPAGTYVYIPKKSLKVARANEGKQKEKKRRKALSDRTRVIVLENGAVIYIKE